ncbi:hypothetical protein V1294_007594 [Bradyrhizobium sp. AZCC 1678]
MGPTEKQRDDLNVDAVFAKFKTIGGKKHGDEEQRLPLFGLPDFERGGSSRRVLFAANTAGWLRFNRTSASSGGFRRPGRS